MAELVFFSGTMDCGKSTLALQMDHNHAARGRAGVIFTKLDRAGEAVLSSRLGLATSALEVVDDLTLVRGRHQLGFGGNAAYARGRYQSSSRAAGIWIIDGSATGPQERDEDHRECARDERCRHGGCYGVASVHV